MKSNIVKYKKDIDALCERGYDLQLGLINELNPGLKASKDISQEIVDKIKIETFKSKYQSWYNESLATIKQLIPNRLDDFISYYKQPKRKDLTHENYTISDYMIGLQRVTGWDKEVIVSTSAVSCKFEQQYRIVQSLKSRFDSSLYEIKQLLQADVFDSELDSAKELWKKGFYRAAGAICGVLIEKHLSEVCRSHSINITKKHPCINDYNELLKANEVVDVISWRFIQRLGDLRNLCDHNKEKEPSKEDVEELIQGTDKVIKTIY